MAGSTTTCITRMMCAQYPFKLNIWLRLNKKALGYKINHWNISKINNVDVLNLAFKTNTILIITSIKRGYLFYIIKL